MRRESYDKNNDQVQRISISKLGPFITKQNNNIFLYFIFSQ